MPFFFIPILLLQTTSAVSAAKPMPGPSLPPTVLPITATWALWGVSMMTRTLSVCVWVYMYVPNYFVFQIYEVILCLPNKKVDTIFFSLTL